MNGWHVLRPSYWEPVRGSQSQLWRKVSETVLRQSWLSFARMDWHYSKGEAAQQQCHVQARGKDAGACSCSGPFCWGWQHGQEAACPAPLEEVCLVMATPWLDKAAALAVSDDLSVLLLDCARLYYTYILIERLVLQLQLYPRLTFIFTSPQRIPKRTFSDCNIHW